MSLKMFSIIICTLKSVKNPTMYIDMHANTRLCMHIYFFPIELVSKNLKVQV